MLVAAVAVPYIIILIGLFLLAGYCLFSYAIKAYKDCYRISQVSMSPILSFFQETFTGGSVIRAFGKDEQFRQHSFMLVDRQAVSNLVTMGVWGWYSLRVVFLSGVLLASGCAACILLKGHVSDVLLSMMLQYLLTLQAYLLYMLYFYGEIERKMVSIQRLFDLETIPQEGNQDKEAAEVSSIEGKPWPT